MGDQKEQTGKKCVEVCQKDGKRVRYCPTDDGKMTQEEVGAC